MMSERTGPIELSVVMPCLNEAESLGRAVAWAKEGLERAGAAGEIIVADNGSTDGSQAIAASLGARVIDVPKRGYGNALRAGFASARGRYIVMGDSDGSYDFREIPQFLAKLRDGCDFVQGCRLPSGGGTVAPGAMPWSHRWIGNPLFSWMARRFCGAPVHDIYCGLRGFTKELSSRLTHRCEGMEFAVEMVTQAVLSGARIAEVPITLHVDAREQQRSHLRTVRDGLRTLSLLLVLAPRLLFVWPGIALAATGALCYAVALPGLVVSGVRFDAHTLLLGSMFIVAGFVSVLFGCFASILGAHAGIVPADSMVQWLRQRMSLRRAFIASIALVSGGAVLLGEVFLEWRAGGFGNLSYPHTMRRVVPGVTFVIIGFQTLLAGFFGVIVERYAAFGSEEPDVPLRASSTRSVDERPHRDV